ncbi:UPF0134 protein MPN_137 [Geodia barretti]|uniref:UPF0134 protein MPN_137 n=1 Tax=Geodia barretti TaxID=519541 RepID=A0AA35VT71_GEOBA|nr:UPF0134 protein MPN_137 [Geodia barretti]
MARVSDQRLTAVENRLDAVENRLGTVEVRLDAVEVRLGAVENRLGAVENRVDDVALKVDDLTVQQTTMQGQLNHLSDQQTIMQGQLNHLSDQQTIMQGQINHLSDQQTTMQGQQTTMQGQQTTMQGQLNNLTGTDYERKVVRRAHRIVRRHLGVSNGQVLVAINRPDGQTITDLLDAGADQGIITEDDADELDRADIILRGNSPDGDDVYVVGEISITIDDGDIDRADHRSRILQNASRVATRAAVIGSSISDANRERAANSRVTVVILDE